MSELKRGKQPYYFKNKPLLRTKIVAFGQAAGKIADIFAQFETTEGKASYEVFALNSNDADLDSLKHISPANRYSLGVDGFGKDPKTATRTINRSPEMQAIIKDFVRKINTYPDNQVDDLHLYIAAMGGGTGTSTIHAALKEYIENYVDPIFKPLVAEKMEEWKADPTLFDGAEDLLSEVKQIVAEKLPRIGLVLITPPYNEGGEVLRQAYNYASKIYNETAKAESPVGFINFPDNHFFHEEFKKLSSDEHDAYKSVHNWANEQIAYAFHGILTACGLAESSKLLDRKDMKRLLLEDKGTLLISHSSKYGVGSSATINDVVSQFEKLVGTNILHDALPLVEVQENAETGEKEEVVRRFTNLGVISVTDIAAGRIDGETASSNVLSMLSEKLKVAGTVFDSFLPTVNNNESTAYLISKINTPPDHLANLRSQYEDVKGAVEEQKSIVVQTGIINERLNLNNEDALSQLEIMLGKTPVQPEVKKEEKIISQAELDKLASLFD